MPDGEDYVWRPVMRKLISYESLVDGTLDLEDIAKLNHAIDVQDENERRIRDANRKQ